MSTVKAQFKINNFVTYQVTLDGISFGFVDPKTGSYTPKKGETLEYDGFTVKLCDGREFPHVHQLRAAIRAGWLYPQTGDSSLPEDPRAAQESRILVRPTEGSDLRSSSRTKMVTELEESREVASLEQSGWESASSNPVSATHISPTHPTEEISDSQKGMLISLLSALDTHNANTDPHPEHSAPPPRKKVTESGFSNHEAKLGSARRLPVDVQEERKTYPIVQDTSTHENVVATIGSSPSPSPSESRPFSPKSATTDDQRYVGKIALSQDATPATIEDSAAAKMVNRELISIQKQAQVGNSDPQSTQSSSESGQVVGTIRSPASSPNVRVEDEGAVKSAIRKANAPITPGAKKK